MFIFVNKTIINSVKEKLFLYLGMTEITEQILIIECPGSLTGSVLDY